MYTEFRCSIGGKARNGDSIMGRYWGTRGHSGAIVSGILILVILTDLSENRARAAERDPLILFNHEASGSLIYSYFDTADPGMANPVDIAKFPCEKDCKTLGIFNGVLYFEREGGKLAGIDLGSGEELNLNTTLPKSFVREGAMLYMRPQREGANEVGMIDLRGPFARSVPLPSGATGQRNLYPSADDPLRYFYAEEIPPADGGAASSVGEFQQLQCGIVDLRSPEAPLLEFEVTVRRTWRIEPSQMRDFGQGDPGVVVVRSQGQMEALSFTWVGRERFACVALALEVEGFAWEGSGEDAGDGPRLFVLDWQYRTARALSLSTLSRQAPGDPVNGGPAPNLYTIDPGSMALLEPNDVKKAGGPEALSEHFNLSRHQGPMQVLHGAQPLEMNREQVQSHTDVDSTGERILLRFPRGSVCYDIYNGYYAACEPRNYFRFMERSELHRVEAAPPAGWTGLLSQPARGLPKAAPAAARRDRASAYELVAVPSQVSYPEGATVTIQITLTYSGASDAWTDVPAPDFPILSGTLAGPAYSVLLSNLPGFTRQPPALPVYLSPGGVLNSTLAFIPEVPGAYTLAMAYGGNPESEWFGRARAPLVHFTVGDASGDGNARLRYAIQDFIERRGNMGDKFFEELRAAGDEGADLLAGMLLEMPMPHPQTELLADDDIYKHWSTVSSLYGYLRDLRSPRLIPFFQKLLASDDRDLKYNGFFGIQALHERSKDPAFRGELEAIVRDAYADDGQIWKARAEKDLGVVLFPALYDELKAQAIGSDAALQRESLKTMAEQYLWRLDTFSGDMERFIGMMLANEQFSLSSSAMICVGQFYGRGMDLPNAQRAIDEYRLHHPEWFDGDFLDTETDLWDMAWLRRAALEPTEARFDLLQRSVVPLETHCGVVRSEAYPKTWQDLASSDAAKTAFAEVLKAWADCIQSNPAPFRVPDLKK